MSRMKIASGAAGMVAVLCVGGWAGLAWSGEAARAGGAPSGAQAVAGGDDLEGRWEGRFHGVRRKVACTGDTCNRLTLDVTRCGAGWCGVEVASDGACKDVAMRLEGKRIDAKEAAYAGSLQLAAATEPYVLRVNYQAKDTDEGPILWLIGDTGGEMRLYRRSFPFEAQLHRVAAATCKADTKTS